MQEKIVRTILICFLAVFTTACSDRPATQEDLKEYLSNHTIGMSPDYAIMKNGDDYLATIHGYSDDLAVCMALIKPMNEDPSLSVMPGTYSCVPLNH